MELYKELLIEILLRQDITVTFPNLKLDINKLLEAECYKALNAIKKIVNDEEPDPESFMKIEKIVSLFNDMHIDSGARHDFG